MVFSALMFTTPAELASARSAKVFGTPAGTTGALPEPCCQKGAPASEDSEPDLAPSSFPNRSSAWAPLSSQLTWTSRAPLATSTAARIPTPAPIFQKVLISPHFTPPSRAVVAARDTRDASRIRVARTRLVTSRAHPGFIPLPPMLGRERQGDMVSAAPARNHDQRARLALQREDRAPQRLRVAERASADREQDVAALQPDLGRAAARAHAADREAAARCRLEREPEQIGQQRRDEALRDLLGAYGQLARLAIAHGRELDLLACGRAREALEEIARRLERLAVDLRDHVAAPDARALARAVRAHARDDRAARRRRQLEGGDESRVEILEIEAEPDRRHFSVIDQLAHDAPRGVDRDREADPLRAVVHRRVDRDQLAFGVEQRAARIARIDRRVGLQESVVDALVVDAQRSPERGDHARRDGMRQYERIADCDHRLTDHEIGRRAGLDPGQLLLRLHLEHGDVVVRVRAEQP